MTWTSTYHWATAIHHAVIALNAERNSDPLGNRRISAWIGFRPARPKVPLTIVLVAIEPREGAAIPLGGGFFDAGLVKYWQEQPEAWRSLSETGQQVLSNAKFGDIFAAREVFGGSCTPLQWRRSGDKGACNISQAISFRVKLRR
jgi:hypothetical protein